MTTIAWDGKTLAGDRQTTWGGTPVRTRKVHKVRHPVHGTWLFGCAGSAFDCAAFERWANGLGQEVVFSEFRVLAIHESGSIWAADESMKWLRLNVERWAIGSGSDYALGAMVAGRSSREAVQVAMELDVNTGIGVDCLRF
jgi:ATP-dependent protease HslVU (ClpYQ) peptidase subunit